MSITIKKLIVRSYLAQNKFTVPKFDFHKIFKGLPYHQVASSTIYTILCVQGIFLKNQNKQANITAKTLNYIFCSAVGILQAATIIELAIFSVFLLKNFKKYASSNYKILYLQKNLLAVLQPFTFMSAVYLNQFNTVMGGGIAFSCLLCEQLYIKIFCHFQCG
ncbi:Hypothetical_protein [Hexamita inflata]|uniref:Hypothetical_protein n=1 Tax=Hexamita inflata TaxID=28002 RepID=A0AA86NHQ1_9EUKA|nr:Hypothetical protein HINF_LOCUS7070 [Hexamita inflata]